MISAVSEKRDNILVYMGNGTISQKKMLREVTAAFVSYSVVYEPRCQNSVIDVLIYGVPQIICPGKVFERKYNADSVIRTGAGIELSYMHFNAKAITDSFKKILSDKTYRHNALCIGKKLLSLGGVTKHHFILFKRELGTKTSIRIDRS